MKKYVFAALCMVYMFYASSLDKSFVVLVASYNNEKVVQNNIDSILQQNYSKFRVIYINDMSTDKTLERLTEILKNHPRSDLVTVINNQVNMGGLANYYLTIHDLIQDDEVVVCLDGDDFFYDKNVLAYLNMVYTRYNVWMTYGQFVFSSNRRVGWNVDVPQKVIRTNSYREFTYVPTHLRTFYAWLFKKIKLEDLQWKDGEFFPMAWDMAFMFPMLEMSGGKFKFIRRPTYIYNDQNPINDHKKDENLQREIASHIRNMNKYFPLKGKESD